jgi:hypothetical protein
MHTCPVWRCCVAAGWTTRLRRRACAAFKSMRASSTPCHASAPRTLSICCKQCSPPQRCISIHPSGRVGHRARWPNTLECGYSLTSRWQARGGSLTGATCAQFKPNGSSKETASYQRMMPPHGASATGDRSIRCLRTKRTTSAGQTQWSWQMHSGRLTSHLLSGRRFSFRLPRAHRHPAAGARRRATLQPAARTTVRLAQATWVRVLGTGWGCTPTTTGREE